MKIFPYIYKETDAFSAGKYTKNGGFFGKENGH